MKNQIEGTETLRRELLDAGTRIAQTHLHHSSEPGASDIAARYLRVLWVGFQRDQTATRSKRPRQPDAAVSAQRAYLENLRGAGELRQQHEKLTLTRSDADRRQPSRLTGGQGRIRGPASGGISRSVVYWSTAVHNCLSIRMLLH